ncbi:hypothetical protein VP01_1627g2 [Puccinia sorghi]|uniref:Uncharacterized protein n=1 Tax=Puccinia sorghi TaxID=27349 RepID=A0A0L6VHH0_9BASI|nr:hypothetical protein VP01_1627g2 [Puccinia sorghi]
MKLLFCLQSCKTNWGLKINFYPFFFRKQAAGWTLICIEPIITPEPIFLSLESTITKKILTESKGVVEWNGTVRVEGSQSYSGHPVMKKAPKQSPVRTRYKIDSPKKGLVRTGRVHLMFQDENEEEVSIGSLWRGEKSKNRPLVTAMDLRPHDYFHCFITESNSLLSLPPVLPPGLLHLTCRVLTSMVGNHQGLSSLIPMIDHSHTNPKNADSEFVLLDNLVVRQVKFINKNFQDDQNAHHMKIGDSKINLEYHKYLFGLQQKIRWFTLDLSAIIQGGHLHADSKSKPQKSSWKSGGDSLRRVFSHHLLPKPSEAILFEMAHPTSAALDSLLTAIPILTGAILPSIHSAHWARQSAPKSRLINSPFNTSLHLPTPNKSNHEIFSRAFSLLVASDTDCCTPCLFSLIML